MRKIPLYSLVFPALLLLSACSSTSLKEDSSPDRGRGRPEPPRPCCVNPDGRIKPHDDPDSILAKRSIYFDYDQYTVKEEFRPLIEAHAKYLIANPKLEIRLNGNTDARGGREYNLALGEKRAQSVRRIFLMYGVMENRMETISYGEERPKALGEDEAAWAENRRVDIVYEGK